MRSSFKKLSESSMKVDLSGQSIKYIKSNSKQLDSSREPPRSFMRNQTIPCFVAETQISTSDDRGFSKIQKAPLYKHA